MKKKEDKGNRRKFLKNSFAIGAAALATGSGAALANTNEVDEGAEAKTEKIKREYDSAWRSINEVQ